MIFPHVPQDIKHPSGVNPVWDGTSPLSSPSSTTSIHDLVRALENNFQFIYVLHVHNKLHPLSYCFGVHHVFKRKQNVSKFTRLSYPKRTFHWPFWWWGGGGGGSVGKGLLVGQTGYNQTLVYGHLISMDSFYGHFSVIINGV